MDQSVERVYEQRIQIGPQYLVITPCDHNSWSDLKKNMLALFKDMNASKFIQFVQKRYKAKGYSNIRLLQKIKVQYFWNGVTKFMVQSMIKDSHILQCKVNVLISEQNTILKLTKYQIFLIMCHLFVGTFPSQVYAKDIDFGKLMTVNDDQDQCTSKQKINFRCNKLKAIVRYFCLFYKRSQQNPEIKEEMIIFQRYGQKLKDGVLLDDSMKFCRVHPKIGEFYANNNQIDSISINNISSIPINTDKSIPGSDIHRNQMEIEQKIFFSHPQMLILPTIMHEGLEQFQTLLIHGAQKYSQMDALSKQSLYNFTQKYRDMSEINKIHNFKITTFIFLKRCHYTRKNKHNILNDVKKVFCGLKAAELMHSRKQKLISGYFHTVRNKKYEMPWDMKFLVDWIAASLVKWDSLHYYTQSEIQAVNLKILVKQLKDYTFNDIQSVIDSYYEFKNKNRGKLTLLQYFKDFAL